MAALGLTLPSANGGAPLTFTVLGESTGNEATLFSNEVKNLVPIVYPLTSAAPQSPASFDPATPILNEYFSSSTSPGTFAIPGSDEYTAFLNAVPLTVTGSTGGGDTVVSTGETTYNANSGNNNVTFLYGNNTFNGANDSVGGDTITGGEGFDTINTGTGTSTVFSGIGTTTINLNDTAPGGDIAFLGDGHGYAYADGKSDTVVTGVSQQTISGAGNTDAVNADNLLVLLESKTQNPNFNGSDVVIGGSANTVVVDSVGGNTIFGGTGNLDVVGETRPGLVVADTIFAGTGSTAIFSTDADDFTFGSAAGSPVLTINAGLGNETLNGANAQGGADFFFQNTTGDTGAAATKDASTPINDTVTGSDFYNYFATGSGNEAIVGGTGENIFGIGLGGAGTSITIFDFAQGSANYINFLGESASQITAIENSATTDSNGNLQLTLSDNSTVTFVGIDSINQISSHIIGG